MPETDDSAEIDVTIETEVVDVDDDGVADIVSQTTTTTIDVDGDGTVDIVEVSTITAIDVDGDGEVDIIESTTVTGVDVDGDGEFDEDEIAVEEVIAVREGLAEELDEAERTPPSEPPKPTPTGADGAPQPWADGRHDGNAQRHPGRPVVSLRRPAHGDGAGLAAALGRRARRRSPRRRRRNASPPSTASPTWSWRRSSTSRWSRGRSTMSRG